MRLHAWDLPPGCISHIRDLPSDAFTAKFSPNAQEYLKYVRGRKPSRTTRKYYLIWTHGLVSILKEMLTADIARLPFCRVHHQHRLRRLRGVTLYKRSITFHSNLLTGGCQLVPVVDLAWSLGRWMLETRCSWDTALGPRPGKACPLDSSFERCVNQR